MALDRQSIEKKDFPVGRRGYDPDAVDAHLAALADEITEFKLSSRRRADTLASSASDQVRAIVEAAEQSAADIQRDAETEAREIREEANSEATAMREQASEQAREYVSKIAEPTAGMLQRIDAMESELSSLIDALRTGGNRLDSDLRLLESKLAEVSDAATSRRIDFEPEESEQPGQPGQAEHLEATGQPEQFEHPGHTEQFGEPGQPEQVGQPEPPAPAAGDWGANDDDVDDDFYDPDAPQSAGGSSEAEAHEAAPYAEPVAHSDESRPAGVSGDTEGARLIALNMALNGTPRDETARYLSENFELADGDRLLDEVYASVDG